MVNGRGGPPTFFSGMRVLERCDPTHRWPALGWLRASSCSHWKQVVRWVKQERVSRCTSMLRVSRLFKGRGAEQAMMPAPSAPSTHIPHSLPFPPTSCPSYILPTHSPALVPFPPCKVTTGVKLPCLLSDGEGVGGLAALLGLDQAGGGGSRGSSVRQGKGVTKENHTHPLLVAERPHPLTIRHRSSNTMGLLSKLTPRWWMTLSVIQLRAWLGCPRRCVVRVLEMYLRMGNERDMSEGMWLGRLPAPRMGDIGGVGGVRPGPSPDRVEGGPVSARMLS